jgi:hypothetical protein
MSVETRASYATPISPFLREAEFEGIAQNEAAPLGEFESPFVAARLYAGEEEAEAATASPEILFLAEMQQELHSAEFEDAVNRFSGEVVGLYERQLSNLGGSAAMEAEAVVATTEFFHPAFREFEAAIDRINQEAGHLELFDMEQETVQTLFERHQPEGTAYGEFEYLFEAFWKKAKGAAGAVARKGRKARRAGARGLKGRLLGKLLGFLKRMFRKLLNVVLRKAIGKLPAALRPAAQRLRQRLLGGTSATQVVEEPNDDAADDGDSQPISAAPVDDAALEPDEGSADTGTDPQSAVQDSDELISASLFELEGYEAEFQPEAWMSAGVGESDVQRLDEARAVFMEALARAKPQEDLSPHVENFLPAIIPLLRVCMKLGLRKPVAQALGRLIAKFIARMVGPSLAQPLGQSIASAGLKMLGFETAQESEAQSETSGHYEQETPARISLAAQTVESTVMRLAEATERLGLTGRDLEDKELFEALAVQAFEQAAAENWAGRMMRPELRESSDPDGHWMLAPANSTRKKYKVGPTRRIRIDPASADTIAVFAGRTLGEFLFQQKGLPRRPIDAIIHLYEAIPGTTLSYISLLEKGVPGLGHAKESAWGQIHPLTTEAAGSLMGSGGLGRSFAAKWMVSPNKIQIGHRFYFLEIVNQDLGTAPGPGPGSVAVAAPRSVMERRPSEFNLVVNCQSNKIVAALFIAEQQAQQVATSLRSGNAGAVLLQAVTAVLSAAAQNMTDGRGKHIQIIPKAEQLKPRGRMVLRMVMRWFRQHFFKWLARVIVKRIQRELTEFSQTFTKATEDPAWGVTVTVTLDNPPAMEAIGAALQGKLKLPPLGPEEVPASTWSVTPGFSRG